VSETVQRVDSFGIDDALVERVELERIADAVEFRHYGPDLVMDEQRPATPEETAAHEQWETSQNIDELRAQAEKAIAKNKNYAQLDPPTAAQQTKQIEELTKQMNGVIRQVIGFYDDIDASEVS
jgi:hypothetical protein